MHPRDSTAKTRVLIEYYPKVQGSSQIRVFTHKESNVTVTFPGHTGIGNPKSDGKSSMNGTTTGGERSHSQVHFRHHALCWALPVALCLLAPLTYGVTLIPAALRTVQLLRRQTWLGEASVVTVRGILWRRVTQLPLADIAYIQMKPELLGQALDCGTLIVFASNGSRLVLSNLAHPKEAQRALQRALKVLPRRGHLRDTADLPNSLPAAV